MSRAATARQVVARRLSILPGGPLFEWAPDSITAPFEHVADVEGVGRGIGPPRSLQALLEHQVKDSHVGHQRVHSASVSRGIAKGL